MNNDHLIEQRKALVARIEALQAELAAFDDMFGIVQLEGTRAAAEYVGVSRQTIANWVALGLKHELRTIGKHKILVFNKADIDQFNATYNHTRGVKAKPAEQS